jgi:hypothetical protein
MSHHDQMAVIRVWLDLFQLVDREQDIGNAAIILQPAADIFFPHLRHHRIVGLEVVLDAHDHVAAGGKNVGEKGVLGEFDGIAMIEDRHGQFDHVGHRLHLPVAANGDIDGDRAVASQRVKECQRLVMDRPFARGEIGDCYQRANRKHGGNAAFHDVCSRQCMSLPSK